jgi:predicted dehydrogenase
MEPLRVGIIGCGAIAQMMHLPFLRELDDRFRIAALSDIDPVALTEVGRRYGVDRLFSDASALLDEPLDAVFILSSGDHAPLAIAALERGLHVLSEKPLAYTLRETDEVIAAAKRSGKTLMVAMMKQYDPGYERGVELVRELRDLRYVNATTLEADGSAYTTHYPIARGSGPRRSADEAPAYGPDLFNGVQRGILGNEPRDLLREATGSDDPDVLTAYFLLIASSIHDICVLRGALGQPDGVLSANVWAGGTSYTAVLAYPNDVRATCTWTMIPYLRNYAETFSFYGSDGRVHINFPSPYLKHFPTYVDVERMNGNELEQTRLTVSYEEAFKRELLEFDDCVRTDRTPRTSAEGFRQDLEVLTAIARAFPANAAMAGAEETDVDGATVSH